MKKALWAFALAVTLVASSSVVRAGESGGDMKDDSGTMKKGKKMKKGDKGGMDKSGDTDKGKMDKK
jgi:hypothetical protein